MAETSYRERWVDAAAVAHYQNEVYSPASFDSRLWEIEQDVLGRILDRYCPDHFDAEAIDFACGTGRILAFLKPRVRSLIGLDISREMLNAAAQNVPDVELICADIMRSPSDVPSDKDIITSFRFLLMAEPGLRVGCLQALATKLRSAESILVLNSHGNPWSYRLLADWRNRLFRKPIARLPTFSLSDMQHLARDSGLRLVYATGLGFVPPSLARLLPQRVNKWVDGALAGCPILWRLGSHLMFVLRRSG